MDAPTDRPRARPPSRSRARSVERAPRVAACVSYSKPRFPNHPYQLRWDTIGHSIRMRSIARRARARGVIPAHSTIAMSALLASSFVGRVAAFKATKVQVRFFRVFFSRRATRSRTTKSSREDEDVDDEECAMVGRSRGIDRARARRVRASREAARDGGAETTRVGKWDARSHRVSAFASRLRARERGRG